MSTQVPIFLEVAYGGLAIIGRMTDLLLVPTSKKNSNHISINRISAKSSRDEKLHAVQSTNSQ